MLVERKGGVPPQAWRRCVAFQAAFQVRHPLAAAAVSVPDRQYAVD